VDECKPLGGGGGGVSSKTPVQRTFVRSMELSQNAARTNAYSAQAGACTRSR